MDSITYSRPIGPKKKLTEAQLAGYAKARATRAAKKKWYNCYCCSSSSNRRKKASFS